ncbi:hypothetical protein HS088_TW04G00294 [Tripterygium wilfordii]|uniref:C2 NT-type domain-containing protein n=1 Tax=Tripterygium wilfordii TaxID=458696 RepID=A0A7J7DPR6_TRIWF|nr:protein PLASTID MOVEMENT IMPAIRED 1-RELATED 2-like [Tripterygium wilfordii]KAF5748341.1 hypothetical protein HS088_TW04G00294 [Tripterygium wilfordii]
MMWSNIEPGNKDSDESSDNGELLRDIEEISKALYLNRIAPKPSSDVQSKFAGNTHISESKWNPIPRSVNENVSHKDKKSSSSWNWKRPLKALAHVRHQKFNTCFFLHVHSIEGLPASFNDFNVRVHWKRKEEVLQTRATKVARGLAEFDETLLHKCCVYGSRSGSHHSAKYDGKLFLIYASVVGDAWLDLGKHWVDLTRLLPITLEELEGEKNSGRWTTSFKLAGKAMGATLNVSFSFLVLRHNFVESRSNMNVSDFVKFAKNKATTVGLDTDYALYNNIAMLRQMGSTPSTLDPRIALSSQSTDGKVRHEALPNLGLELSTSIRSLYQKLNEENIHGSGVSNISAEHMQPLKPKYVLDFASADDFSGDENYGNKFVVIEQGTEMMKNEQLISVQTNAAIDGSAIEIINVDDIMKDDDLNLYEGPKGYLLDNVSSSYVNKVLLNDCKLEEDVECVKGSALEQQETTLQSLLTSESVDLESPPAVDEFLDQESYIGTILNYKTSKMVKKSHSLDDITESVASDFLNMLGIEQSSCTPSSNCDPESPRERLLREFEEEALVSGNFLLDFDAEEELAKFGCISPEMSGCDLSEDFDFSQVIQAAKEEHNKASQLLRRRKAKELEDLETEALMREWGLDEKAFQNSPRNCSDGFGSPIELPPELPFQLPPLGDGFGPLVLTKGGGYLRSMNPSLFRNSNHVRSLIIQVSSPIVLPAEMGSDIMEILLHLASVGIEKLSLQANILMPMVDVTGKTTQQIVEEAATSRAVPDRQTQLQHKSLLEQDSSDVRKEFEGFSSVQCYNNLSSSLIGGEIGNDIVSAEDLIPLAMDKIEVLIIEGLRIQSDMSDEGAPASISCQSVEKINPYEGKKTGLGGILSLERATGLQLLDISDSSSEVDGLLGLSIAFDEWLRLDAGITIDEDQISEHTKRFLAAHHANTIDFVNGRGTNWGDTYGRKHGLLGNNLTIAFMVLLRDPLRNYEPVGSSMLALVQVQKVVHPKADMYGTLFVRSGNEEECELIIEEEDNQKEDKGGGEEEKEEDAPASFKIIEAHLAGLNIGPARKQLWGSKAQQLSGTRWLLATGMGKTWRHPISKSKAIVVSNTQGMTKFQSEDIIWSISSHFDDTQTNWKDSTESVPYERNPDVISSC